MSRVEVQCSSFHTCHFAADSKKYVLYHDPADTETHTQLKQKFENVQYIRFQILFKMLVKPIKLISQSTSGLQSRVCKTLV